MSSLTSFLFARLCLTKTEFPSTISGFNRQEIHDNLSKLMDVKSCTSKYHGVMMGDALCMKHINNTKQQLVNIERTRWWSKNANECNHSCWHFPFLLLTSVQNTVHLTRFMYLKFVERCMKRTNIWPFDLIYGGFASCHHKSKGWWFTRATSVDKCLL
jgi:hypothetical protein